MKLSHRWLLRHVPDLPEPSGVARYLEGLGIEVAAMGPWGEDFGTVQLVEVVVRDKHPEADHLSLVTVRLGSGELVTVVTGAANGWPGDRVWYAPPGTKLADGRIMEVAQIRGAQSPGMLLSASELGFMAGAGDLWIWSGTEPTGTVLLDVLGGPDTVYECELTPNLAAFLQSHGAVSRELAAIGKLGRVKEPPPFAFGEAPLARVEDAADCPLYGLVELTIQPDAPTPLWLQALLRSCGMRPIHPAVDVTNYLLWDWGQPLHAFDADRVTLPIEVRRARAGERLTTLDNQDLALTPDDLVIADATSVLALAGVIGGRDSAVTPHTRRVLLESAQFRPELIRATMRRHRTVSDAAAHFSRGTDPQTVWGAPSKVISVLADAGVLAEVRSSTVLGQLPAPVRVPWDPERTRRLLGVDWTSGDLEEALTAMGFVVEGDCVEVPRYRHDVDGLYDLAEEIARYRGLDAIVPSLPVSRMTLGRRDPRVAFIEKVRQAWVEAGYFEVVTRAFTSPQRAGVLRVFPDTEPVRLTNPIREDESQLRTDLLTGVLEVMAYNRSRRDQALALFEVASVFAKAGGDAAEHWQLAVVKTLDPVAAYPPGVEPSIYDLKGALQWVDRTLNWGLAFGDGVALPGFLHPGRSLAIFRRDTGAEVGFLGELRPRVAEMFRGRRVGVLLVAVDGPAEGARGGIVKPSRYPEVVRDLSLVVPESVSYGQLEAAIVSAASDTLRQAALIDRFVGPFGQSLTVRLTFQSAVETLTDEQVDAEIRHILTVLATHGIAIRQ